MFLYNIIFSKKCLYSSAGLERDIGNVEVPGSIPGRGFIIDKFINHLFFIYMYQEIDMK